MRLTTVKLILGTWLVVQGIASARAERPRILAHAIPTPNAKPYIIVVGPDHNLWFAESGGDRIGRLDPTSGQITEFSAPSGSHPTGITAGPHGNLWFSEFGASKIGRISTSGAITEFVCPTPNAGPNGMFTSDDGSIWFSESNADQIAKISPTGEIIEYGKGISRGSFPLSIVSRAGELWFSEPNGNRLARFKNGVSIEMPMAPNTQPRSMTNHPDGSLWFVATSAHALARVDTHNQIKIFPLTNPHASLRAVKVAANGDIWFTEDGVDQIGVMNSTGRVLAEYPIPAPMHGLRGLTILTDGRVFFSAFDSGHIGELIPAK